MFGFQKFNAGRISTPERKIAEAPPPLFIKPDLSGCHDINQIFMRIKAATEAR